MCKCVCVCVCVCVCCVCVQGASTTSHAAKWALRWTFFKVCLAEGVYKALSLCMRERGRERERVCVGAEMDIFQSLCGQGGVQISLSLSVCVCVCV